MKSPRTILANMQNSMRLKLGGQSGRVLEMSRPSEISFHKDEEVSGEKCSSETLLAIKEEVVIDDDTANVTNETNNKNQVGNRKQGLKYSCDLCNVSYKFKRTYSKHMRKHSELRPFKCKVCGKKFKYKSGLKKHVRDQHDDTAPLYSCKICEFSTKHYPYLQVHFTRKHTDDYKYKCSSCKKQFKVETDYKVHMADHETGLFVCDFCGLTYSNKSSLYYHRNYKHTNKLKSFECKVCNKKLQSEKNLKIHLKQHEETFVCEECGMKFARKHGLTKHRRVHTKEKLHGCPVCGKAFACTATQRVHFLTHAGLRPYVCNVCGSKFTQRSSLMLHWKRKHPDAIDPPPPVILNNILKTIKLNAE
ncbi:zinc finger protein 37 homolog [Neodiprion virginianus]|uniref:zinc finger protein 37 homolog n=1 Tax=Neodiprion virginianus TaxID=2961670 RepID=UPI001EE773F9|nr:zinc finger protein 37 homolog [Neodiprion virginianus]